jgi:serine/threonine-protein kinase
VRLHDIGDARIEIDDALAEAEGRVPLALSAERAGALPWIVAAAMTLLAVVLGLWLLKTLDSSTPLPLQRFRVVLPPTAPLSLESGASLAFAPDGSRFAYVARRGGTRQLFLWPIDQLDPVPVPGTDGATNPFFSPDGQWLGFFADGKLRKLPLTGGASVSLGDGPNPRGASWGPDQTIVFAPLTVSGLSVISGDGGHARQVTERQSDKEENSHRWPEFLPGGQAVLFTSWVGHRFDIEALSLANGQRKLLIEGGSSPRYAPTGHLLFMKEGTVFAIPFDTKRLEASGSPIAILDNVAMDPLTGAGFFSFSHDGSLVYAPRRVETDPLEPSGALLWVDRQGAPVPIGDSRRAFQLPRLSPDGRTLIATIGVENETDIWGLELQRGTLSRLTFEGSNGAGIWTPDGTRIIFSSDERGPFNIYSKNADGSGRREQILDSDYTQFPTSWSPDGRFLAYTELNPSSGFDVWVLEMNGTRKPKPLLNTRFNESGATFAPDGRYLAYVSDESGQEEVYVRPFPDSGGKWQLSTHGGNEPVWGPTGRELFYRNEGWILSVSTETEREFSASRPNPLFEAPFDEAGITYPNYDVSADGNRFVMVRSEKELVANELSVVLNWFQELERRAPLGGQ